MSTSTATSDVSPAVPVLQSDTSASVTTITPITSDVGTITGLSSAGATITETSVYTPFVTYFTSRPLTTIFTPAERCSSLPWTSQHSTQGTISCARNPASDCYPHGNSLARQVGLYSPSVCPLDYAAYGNWTSTAGGASTFICCPPGMTYLEIVNSCSAVISTGASVIISNQTVNYTEPFTAFASTIAVAYAPSDFRSFTPASAPIIQARLASSAASSSSTTTSSSSSTAAAATSSLAQPQSPPLSPGAKAGIGVGVSIAGIILLALAIWASLRYRKRKRDQQQDNQDSKAELPGKDSEKKPVTISELGPEAEVNEMANRGKPAELHHDARYELESDWHGNEMRGVSSPLRRSGEEVRHKRRSV